MSEKQPNVAPYLEMFVEEHRDDITGALLLWLPKDGKTAKFAVHTHAPIKTSDLYAFLSALVESTKIMHLATEQAAEELDNKFKELAKQAETYASARPN